MENSVVNLNPKYMMTLYDIDMVKKTIGNMDIKELLNKCPTIRLHKNTLFYHPTKMNEPENYASNLGKAPESDQDMTLYYFNFLNHYQQMIKNKQTEVEIMFNTGDLKLLDLTWITVELGFNPIMNRENEVSKKILYNYCKKYKLDGIISFDLNVEKENIQSNFNYIDVETYPISPIVYLTSFTDYGINRLKKLGLIGLKKVSFDEAYKLHNLLFCNIKQIVKIGYKVDVNLDVTIKKNSYNVVLETDEPKNLDYIINVKNKYLLDLLILNNVNLSDQCDFQLPVEKLMDELVIYPDIKNVEITYNIEIDSSNDDFFNMILNEIAINNSINPFAYIHYDKLQEVDYLKNYDYDLINAYYDTMDDIKRLIKNIEKLIISRMNLFYKKSPKGSKSNVNFVNIEYIPDTYNYINNKIMDELEKLPIDEALNLIKGDEFHKNITKYFNVFKLYHSITSVKYDKPKKLYQSLLNDLTTYKNLPTINLSWIKLLSELSDSESQHTVTQDIKNVKSKIYDVYKNYMTGEVMFFELYNFLGIDNLIKYMINFAKDNNLNTSLIVYYDQITKEMNKYSIDYLRKGLKNTDLTDVEFLNQWMEKLKTRIIITKLYDFMINHYKLDNHNDEVNKYIKDEIEKLINIDLDTDDSYIRKLLNTDDWVNPNFNFIYFIRLFESEYTNEKMLKNIYNVLDITLTDKNRRKLLLLVENKNLLKLYLRYLNQDISKKELENNVFTSIVDYKESKKKTSDIEDSEISKKPRKSRKKKIESEEEGTASM